MLRKTLWWIRKRVHTHESTVLQLSVLTDKLISMAKSHAARQTFTYMLIAIKSESCVIGAIGFYTWKTSGGDIESDEGQRDFHQISSGFFFFFLKIPSRHHAIAVVFGLLAGIFAEFVGHRLLRSPFMFALINFCRWLATNNANAARIVLK